MNNTYRTPYVVFVILEPSMDIFQNGKLVVFTNDFFTVFQNQNAEMEISLNEIGNRVVLRR